VPALPRGPPCHGPGAGRGCLAPGRVPPRSSRCLRRPGRRARPGLARPDLRRPASRSCCCSLSDDPQAKCRAGSRWGRCGRRGRRGGRTGRGRSGRRRARGGGYGRRPGRGGRRRTGPPPGRPAVRARAYASGEPLVSRSRVTLQVRRFVPPPGSDRRGPAPRRAGVRPYCARRPGAGADAARPGAAPRRRSTVGYARGPAPGRTRNRSWARRRP
jgi:hypothetical protein